ncbi:MAG: hypothetical protein WD750_12305 [Gammaproteobacteria bacterium]
MAGTHQINRNFVLCIEDRDCDDLQKGKVYIVLKDQDAESEDNLRVMDESGEDYLYPRAYFVPIDLPNEAKSAIGAES